MLQGRILNMKRKYQVYRITLTFGQVEEVRHNWEEKVRHNFETVWLKKEFENVNRVENMDVGLLLVDDVRNSINKTSN